MSCPNGNTALISGRYIDCADGTLIDATAQLMWEQSVSCGAQNFDNPRCAENTYTWSGVSFYYETYLADGTLFTDFLARLNDDVDATGTTSCLAKHCDWRVPTVSELMGILLAPFPCSTSPCVDPAFGPTMAYDYYWSSSTLENNPAAKWGVAFGNGFVGNAYGSFNFFARAVRSGR